MLLKSLFRTPRWILGLSFVFLISIGSSAQDATITIENQAALCAGFSHNSLAQVKITTVTPFRLPNNAGIVYDWYAYHEKGKKEWNTPLDIRKVPTPWAGEYNIWVVIKYVNKQTLSPFNAFKSQVVKINVADCPAEKKVPAPSTIKKKN
jgi:hypothetical protein